MPSNIIEKTHTKCNQLINLINETKNLNCEWILMSDEFKEIATEINKYISYENIQKIGKGTSRTVYRSGSYVLKLGFFFTPLEPPSFSFINRIYYRINQLITYEDNVLYLGVEISDYIEEEEPVSFDDLKSLYFTIRDQGYIWTDAKESNVRKNKNGELIIIDVENIYKYQEQKINFDYYSFLTKKLEQEYKNRNC